MWKFLHDRGEQLCSRLFITQPVVRMPQPVMRLRLTEAPRVVVQNGPVVVPGPGEIHLGIFFPGEFPVCFGHEKIDLIERHPDRHRPLSVRLPVNSVFVYRLAEFPLRVERFGDLQLGAPPEKGILHLFDRLAQNRDASIDPLLFERHGGHVVEGFLDQQIFLGIMGRHQGIGRNRLLDPLFHGKGIGDANLSLSHQLARGFLDQAAETLGLHLLQLFFTQSRKIVFVYQLPVPDTGLIEFFQSEITLSRLEQGPIGFQHVGGDFNELPEGLDRPGVLPHVKISPPLIVEPRLFVFTARKALQKFPGFAHHVGVTLHLVTGAQNLIEGHHSQVERRPGFVFGQLTVVILAGVEGFLRLLEPLFGDLCISLFGGAPGALQLGATDVAVAVSQLVGGGHADR